MIPQNHPLDSLKTPKKKAFEVVKDYIEREKIAGRRPTQGGLEKAAKQAKWRGGRHYLREIFKETPGVEVKRGRPSLQ
jgi:hypothetical protein